MHAPAALRETVADVVERTPVFDIHTHLYDPAFGELLLWGIDELLIYHYLIAEGFRQFDMPYDKFWSLTKTQQTDAIWQALFIEHSPISESCRGVLTVLQALGFDVKKRDLPALKGLPEIGWVFTTPARGKGYATEAVRAAVTWGDAHFSSSRTACIIHPENLASIRVAEKCAYREFQRTTYKSHPTIMFVRDRD